MGNDIGRGVAKIEIKVVTSSHHRPLAGLITPFAFSRSGQVLQIITLEIRFAIFKQFF